MAIIDYLPTASTTWPGTGTGADYVNLFRMAYSNIIRHQMQQTVSKLSDTCQFEPLAGYEKRLDRWNVITLTQRDRGEAFGEGAQPFDQTPVRTVVLVPAFWQFTELFDFRDSVGLMRRLLPAGTYMTNVIGGFNRKRDEVIIAAFDSSVTLGDGGGSSVFPPAQQIDPLLAKDGTAAGAATKMNVAKLIAARHLLETGNATAGQLFCAIHPDQVSDLLKDDTNNGRLVSADFNILRPLMSGEVTRFLGFEFRQTTEIPQEADIDSSSTGAQTGRYVYCYAKEAMVFGTTDFVVAQQQAILQGMNWVFFHDLGLGATRIHDEGVAQIPCADATAAPA